MRKTVLALVMCLFSVAAMAQGHRQHPSHNGGTVSFESRGGEVFSVYVDGTLMNRMPQSRVMLSDLGREVHEVVVVMSRPAQKAAVLNLRVAEPNAVVGVDYDPRHDVLSLRTGAQNVASDVQRPQRQHAGHHPGHDFQGQQVAPQPTPPPAPRAEERGTSEEQFSGMLARMKAQSFDNDRLALGKVIVSSSSLTAEQIGRLAETMEFASTRVEFLKYAYQYCADPVNYYKTTDVLTFSSDKKKLLDFIATQK
ncbi:MAG: DUF4476 domain-containing protein [Bacteroidales bacterium]|nr:DUF4476 domain-containing protein [Bacteroidales bacterium]